MGWDDELGDMKNEAKGAAKDYVGMATGDADPGDESQSGQSGQRGDSDRRDQHVSKLKQGTEKVREAFKKH